MPLEPVIGLEIHVQLKTASKMFCSCANIFGDVEPNSAMCPICLGYPGTLPVPNAQAIQWIRAAGAALNCELALKSKFDRKSYFYPDLPKGYQISQYDQPFCGKGHMQITVDGKERQIGITRIHLEEDAAKNTHPPSPRLRGTSPDKSDYTLVDYNRAGTPLIEIVTEPDIKSPAEAKVFLQELQRIMRTLNISDADMEKGQLRCDANISLKEVGSSKLNPKTEVKNINSFRNVERALQYEIERQTKEHAEGRIPQNATRGWNADTQKTVAQRTKEEAADYRYFPEPDIPPFVFTEEENKQVRHAVPELPQERRERFQRQYQVSPEHASLLTDLPFLGAFFEETISELEELDTEREDISPKEIKALAVLAANTVLRDLRKLVEENSLNQETLKINPENFAEVVVMLKKQDINKNALPELLAEMQRTGGDPDPIIEKLGLKQEHNADALGAAVDEVVQENADIVEKIKAGKGAALQFLVGQVMAKMRGQANPKVITDLLKTKLDLPQ